MNPRVQSSMCHLISVCNVKLTLSCWVKVEYSDGCVVFVPWRLYGGSEISLVKWIMSCHSLTLSFNIVRVFDTDSYVVLLYALSEWDVYTLIISSVVLYKTCVSTLNLLGMSLKICHKFFAHLLVWKACLLMLRTFN